MKIIVAVFLALLTQGCLFDIAEEILGQVAPKTLLQKNDAVRKIEQQKFIECPDSHFWSTQPFYNGSIENNFVKGEPVTFGPFRSGFHSRHVNNWPTPQIDKRCNNIIDQLLSGIVEHEIIQFFDENEVLKLTRVDNNFHKINPHTAHLIFSHFKEDTRTRKNIFSHSIHIPVSIKCENEWMVKHSDAYPFTNYFKQPEGKCFFSNQGYKLKHSSHQEITIALNGYYTLDPEYPDKNMIIKIEKFGFLED